MDYIELAAQVFLTVFFVYCIWFVQALLEKKPWKRRNRSGSE
jgi:hypothetical protein